MGREMKLYPSKCIKHEFHKMIVGSYLVFYVILEKEIVIARILNSRQNYKRILKQIKSLN